MEPTKDCKSCNKLDLDENGDFRCGWKYPKSVVVMEDGRCFHVVQINEIYEVAKKRSEVMSLMVNSQLKMKDLTEIQDYVNDKIGEIEK